MTIAVLYKYGRLNESSEALFTTPTLWFSPPAELNDPFECRPWLTFDGTEDQIVASLTRTLKRRQPEFTDENARAGAVEMFRSMPSNPDWERTRRGMISQFSERLGLYCLSKVNNSILMPLNIRECRETSALLVVHAATWDRRSQMCRPDRHLARRSRQTE